MEISSIIRTILNPGVKAWTWRTIIALTIIIWTSILITARSCSSAPGVHDRPRLSQVGKRESPDRGDSSKSSSFSKHYVYFSDRDDQQLIPRSRPNSHSQYNIWLSPHTSCAIYHNTNYITHSSHTGVIRHQTIFGLLSRSSQRSQTNSRAFLIRETAPSWDSSPGMRFIKQVKLYQVGRLTRNEQEQRFKYLLWRLFRRIVYTYGDKRIFSVIRD